MAELFPNAKLPPNHQFIGPLAWSPPVPAPDWWPNLPKERPIVYLTLGSSGQTDLLPTILKHLAAQEITVIVATAGGSLPETVPANTYVARYLPGEDAARRSSLVICNGGSPTSHQALAAGVPVIGIASNLDQFLNMDTIVQAGAGALLRADRFSGPELGARVTEILRNPDYIRAARGIAEIAAGYDAGDLFTARLASLLNH